MGRRKKVKGVHLRVKGGGPPLGEKTAIQFEGTGQDGGYAIPRYEKKGFKMLFSPYADSKIKADIGARLCDDGIIRYPVTADVNPKDAAEAQALKDYDGSPGNQPAMKKDMEEIYGRLYTDEFERLKTARNGPSPWKE